MNNHKDLAFLQEMRGRFDSGRGGDATQLDYVQTMIADWIDELQTAGCEQHEKLLSATGITWRPMTEKPAGNATAMIRCTDEEGDALMSGPVTWSISHQRWCDEDTMRPLKLDQPNVTYHWCHEHEITGGRP